MKTTTKPLLSYLLFAYNQENYIREAVESAFAQTYSPLEIIISDDHSTDNTWEIIKELFNKYNGPHKIIINRNKSNLGIANHVNKVMAMAKGQLFIMAAGDDISFPKRTQILYNYWQSNRNKVFAITSSMIGIDSEGNPCKITDRFFEQKIYRLNIEDFYTKYTWCGAGAAYDRKLYDLFGKIIYNFNEDRAYINRCWLIGSTMLVNDILLKYRFGGVSTNKSNFVAFRKRDAFWFINSYKQLQSDIINAKVKISNRTDIYIKKEIEYWLYRYDLYNHSCLYKKLHILFCLFKKFGYARNRLLPIYILPQKLVNKIYSTFKMR